MKWRKWTFYGARLAFSLWLTASAVFGLSRFLPALYAPKGMQEMDVSVNGSQSAQESSAIQEEYKRQRNLHLPFFYISILKKGAHVAEKINTLDEDKAWVRQSVLWHGEAPTRQFYSTLNTWRNTQKKVERKTALSLLNYWATSDSPEEREKRANRFRLVFGKTGLKQEAHTITAAWQTLTTSLSPVSNYLPTLFWNGTENQYHLWLIGILSGQLGHSLRDFTPVTHKIAQALHYSAWIGFTGLILASLISYFIGKALALYSRSRWATALRQGLYLLDSVPGFLLALLILYFFLQMGGTLTYLLPTGNANYIMDTLSLFGQNSFLLSSLSLALLLTPYLSLQLYQQLSFEKSALYMRTARAKGLSKSQAFQQHAFRNALVHMVTLLSEVIIGLVAGILLIEVTFSLPGLGSLLTQSILTADYPVIIGITLFLLCFRVLVVYLAEVIVFRIDPRITAP